MRAGKLDRTIVVQHPDKAASDGAGNFANTWTTLATLRAQVIQASLEEAMRDWPRASEMVVFRTRYVEGVTTDHWVLYEGRRLGIVEVKEIGRRRGLELRTTRPGP